MSGLCGSHNIIIVEHCAKSWLRSSQLSTVSGYMPCTCLINGDTNREDTSILLYVRAVLVIALKKKKKTVLKMLVLFQFISLVSVSQLDRLVNKQSMNRGPQGRAEPRCTTTSKSTCQDICPSFSFQLHFKEGKNW